MAEFEIKILDIETGIKLCGKYPALCYIRNFFDFIRKRYGLKGGFLAVYEAGEPVMACPVNYTEKEIYSVYKDYAEPVFFKKVDENIWPILSDKLKKEFGYDYIEFNFSFGIDEFDEKNFKESGLSRYVLSLGERESEEYILKNFSKKTRNEIRKAEKAGLETRIGNFDREDAYGLYLENMARHGTPAKSMIFFDELFDAYQSRCRAVTAYDSGKLVGANIFFTTENYLRLAYNFSNPRYWNKCVNNLLYFKMIKWGVENGIKIFDFGPSSNKDKSHVHFKIGFGAKQIPIYKLSSGSFRDMAKKWVQQKRYNLKLRINKYGKFGK